MEKTMATAATPVAGKNNKTKAFSVIFFLEFWERFGYYGLMAILTLFFVQSLHMTDAESFATYGAFSALCYGLIAVGGFIGGVVVAGVAVLAALASSTACWWRSASNSKRTDVLASSTAFRIFSSVASGSPGVFRRSSTMRRKE